MSEPSRPVGSGRRVLVTGAAGGLGQALTAAFTARGDRVLTTDRAGAELTLDVTSDADWAAAREYVEHTWGGLDVLVNNAGIAGGGRVDVDTLAEWQRLVEVNLLGTVRGTKAFVPMKAAGAGQIVNIASLAGLVHPAGMGSYNATKAAVVAFTETVGHELAGFGVTAHAVCPGFFRTGLMASVQGQDAAVGAVIGDLVEHSPHGPHDIAAEILTQLDAGTELILPDEAGRAAWALKQDRPAHDAVMRRQAEHLHRAAQRGQAAADE